MNAFTIAWANPMLSLADAFKCGVQVIVEFPTIVVMLASEAAAAALVMPPILLRGCLSGLSVQEESPEAATAAVNPDSKPEGEGTAEGEETANCLPTAPEGLAPCCISNWLSG